MGKDGIKISFGGTGEIIGGGGRNPLLKHRHDFGLNRVLGYANLEFNPI